MSFINNIMNTNVHSKLTNFKIFLPLYIYTELLTTLNFKNSMW